MSEGKDEKVEQQVEQQVSESRKPVTESPKEWKLGALISRHLFTILATLLIVFVALAVPQVRHLFELPRVRPSALVVGFYLYVLALLVIYVALGWWVVPFALRRKSKPDQTRQGAGRAWLAGVADRIRQYRLRVAAASAVVAAGMLLLFWLQSSDMTQWNQAFGAPFLMSIAVLCGTFCAAVLLWERLDLRTQLLWLRILATLVVLNLLGESIWRLSSSWHAFSPRNYTLWAILHTAFCVLLFARVVDYWSTYSRWVRPIAIVLVLLVAARMPPAHVGRLVKKPLSASAPTAQIDGEAADDSERLEPWLEHLQGRLDAIPNDGMPVVLVAASGGGSRAALFTALVYEYLDRTPVEYVSKDETRQYRVNEHILLISSVSGGTLASACYVDSRYADLRDADDGQRPVPRNFIRTEIEELLLDCENLRDVATIPWCDNDVTRPGLENQSYYDLVISAVKSEDPDARWFLHRSFVDDMCTDFMAPLLRGALHMPLERGAAVAGFWESRFGLSSTNLDWEDKARNAARDRDGATGDAESENAESQDSGRNDLPPLLLCNVSEVERGTRVIVGFPPLPRELLRPETEAAHDSRAWVDLDPDGDQFVELRLSEAVRLSANFPWGFSVASTQLTGPNGSLELHLIDGGVVDNTGIDAIRTVLQRLYARMPAENADPESLTRSEQVARDVFAELHRRGVILLEIDSGAKPQRPGWLASFLSGVLEPVRALENAAYANAMSAVETHLHYLKEFLPQADRTDLRERLDQLRAKATSLPPELAQGIGTFPSLKRLTITCNHQENVMTAWALGPNDKATIFLRFLAGSERMRDQLRDYLELRAVLRATESFVAEQEKRLADTTAEPVDEEGVRLALENLRDVTFYAQAVQRKEDLQLKVEQMYYQKMPLPKDYEQQAQQQLPEPEPYLQEYFKAKQSEPEDASTKIEPGTPPSAAPAGQPADSSPVQQTLSPDLRYDAVDNRLQQYDRGLRGIKGKLLDDSRKLQEMRTENP